MLITCLTFLWTIAFVWIRLEQKNTGIPYVDGGWLDKGIIHNEMTILACIIHSFHAWFWCLTIFSWGAYLLNKPSKNLTYFNQGVYPFYIVHMPLTFAGLKISGDLGLKNSFAIIVATVFVGLTCWIFFECVILKILLKTMLFSRKLNASPYIGSVSASDPTFTQPDV